MSNAPPSPTHVLASSLRCWPRLDLRSRSSLALTLSTSSTWKRDTPCKGRSPQEEQQQKPGQAMRGGHHREVGLRSRRRRSPREGASIRLRFRFRFRFSFRVRVSPRGRRLGDAPFEREHALAPVPADDMVDLLRRSNVSSLNQKPYSKAIQRDQCNLCYLRRAYVALPNVGPAGRSVTDCDVGFGRHSSHQDARKGWARCLFPGNVCCVGSSLWSAN